MISLTRVLAHLPLVMAHAIGAVLGIAMLLTAPRVRRMIAANLSRAGLDSRALRWRVALHIGRGVIEIPAIWLRSDAAIGRLVRDISGAEIVAQARAGGHGVIFMTPHLGCFELAGQWLGRDHPMTNLYRPPKLAWLEPPMVLGRKRGKVMLATTDISGVRKLLRALRAKQAIGLLPDQVPGSGEGEWAEFFSSPAYTMTLATRLAESSGAPIIFAFAERLSWGRGYHLHFSQMPQRLPDESSVRHLNRAVEALIRTRPEQYLWSYNRFKRPAGAAAPNQKRFD